MTLCKLTPAFTRDSACRPLRFLSCLHPKFLTCRGPDDEQETAFLSGDEQETAFLSGLDWVPCRESPLAQQLRSARKGPIVACSDAWTARYRLGVLKYAKLHFGSWFASTSCGNDLKVASRDFDETFLASSSSNCRNVPRMIQ